MHRLSCCLAVIVVTALAACGSGKDAPPGTGTATATAASPGTGAATAVPPPGDAAPAGPTLTIAQVPAVAGVVQHTQDDAVQDLSIAEADAGAPTSLRMERHVTKRTKVLDVRGAFRTRVEVHYEAARDVQTAAGKTEEHALPVAGKTYVVARDDAGKLVMATVDGKAVSDDERAFLEEDFGSELGRLPGMAAILTGRAWTQGAPVALGAVDIAQVAADMGAADEVKTATVTWTGTDAQIASFEVVIDLVRAGAVKMPMKAIVKLDVAHARPVEVLGTATIEGATPDGKITGTMTVHTLNRYE